VRNVVHEAGFHKRQPTLPTASLQHITTGAGNFVFLRLLARQRFHFVCVLVCVSPQRDKNVRNC